MEIKPDRMVSLGYGKYWRSDAIVGLKRIDDERGPGRRTEVYTATVDEPIVASRSEQAILHDMAIATDEQFQIQEAREILTDLLDVLEELPDVVGRMLLSEGRLDVRDWARRVRTFLRTEVVDHADQNDLFA